MVKNGLTLLEILIVFFIFSIFLIPITIFIQKYHQKYLLNSSCFQIIEGINFARESAINERCNFFIIFSEKSFKILKEGEKGNEKILIWKEIILPENIKIKEKTDGMNPLIFLPDGTAKEAGHIILIDNISKKEKKIKIQNITGKCVIED
ncbi:MAG: prepilin-type N-terminal cleavage/methylation domain-containing protein [Candidatus Omnitrophica bacterium]|nr:prepilin-type N-terminal cleavage/methylation domain-containing protein [Candidatus Omnitrophota bacterium]